MEMNLVLKQTLYDQLRAILNIKNLSAPPMEWVVPNYICLYENDNMDINGSDYHVPPDDLVRVAISR